MSEDAATSERWSVSCRCDHHGDHAACDERCADELGCRHPVGAEITAATEAEADQLSGFAPTKPSSDLYESVYEEVVALRKLVDLADAMYLQMRDDQQAFHDAFHFMEFGHNGPSLAGALDGADRAYVYHRHQEGPKLGLPRAMDALGQGVRGSERQAALERRRDSYIARIRHHGAANSGSSDATST